MNTTEESHRGATGLIKSLILMDRGSKTEFGVFEPCMACLTVKVPFDMHAYYLSCTAHAQYICMRNTFLTTTNMNTRSAEPSVDHLSLLNQMLMMQ